MAYDPLSTFSTDNVNPPEAVVAKTSCRRVTIRENGGSTQAYNVRKASATSNAISMLAGEPYTFNVDAGAIFKPGDTVGWVETTAGSITMAQIEEF